MAFKDLNAQQRVVAVHTDLLRNADFAVLGALSQVGQIHVSADPFVEGVGLMLTAGTDGCDVWYNEAFVMAQTRKQLRALVAHEQMHKGLHHCTNYKGLAEKYPDEFARAIDYVVNGNLELLDPQHQFFEWPTVCPPLLDPKYSDKSVPEVLHMLRQNSSQQQQQSGAGGHGGPGKPMDTHVMSAKDPTPNNNGQPIGDGSLTIQQAIQDAIHAGEQRAQQLRGNEPGGRSLSNAMQERVTDWRPPLRKFITELCEGDEYSRFCPPNRRLLPQGVIMPSHYAESMDELIVACDTSGSMGGVYALVFGEIAQICKTARPKQLRLLWWDTKIEGEQVFTEKDYDQIAKALKPAGGGGTTVSCVAQHIRAKQYRPKAVIILTDGYIESVYDTPAGPLLWGVVDNTNFVPLRGKKVDLLSVAM